MTKKLSKTDKLTLPTENALEQAEMHLGRLMKEAALSRGEHGGVVRRSAQVGPFKITVELDPDHD